MGDLNKATPNAVGDIPLPWSRLPCDIHLGGSTAQFLTWGREQLSQDAYVRSIKKALIFKAKSNPTLLARRLACLLGLTYDKLHGDDYILNSIFAAFYQIEQRNYE